MRKLRQKGLLGPAALLLAAVFFANQAFACCYAQTHLIRNLASLFAPAPRAEHACCPKPAPVPSPEQTDNSGACCLKDDSRQAPQLASAPADLPDLAAPLALFAPLPELPPRAALIPAPLVDTGPPVYLRTLRLLV